MTLTRGRKFLITGLCEEEYSDFSQEVSLEPYAISYDANDFGMPIAKVSESVLFYLSNPDARETLPSWGDETFDAIRWEQDSSR